ncbi:isoaspartyl peptidase/L-asparaginase [Escherichia coli]
MGKAVIAIHGGAGAISRAQMSLQAGITLHSRRRLPLFSKPGENAGSRQSALDVVTEAVHRWKSVHCLTPESGAVFTRDETHELDACVMDGQHPESQCGDGHQSSA